MYSGEIWDRGIYSLTFLPALTSAVLMYYMYTYTCVDGHSLLSIRWSITRLFRLVSLCPRFNTTPAQTSYYEEFAFNWKASIKKKNKLKHHVVNWRLRFFFLSYRKVPILLLNNFICCFEDVKGFYISLIEKKVTKTNPRARNFHVSTAFSLRDSISGFDQYWPEAKWDVEKRDGLNRYGPSIRILLHLLHIVLLRIHVI